MLQQTVSKSRFKAHLLEYLRILEESKKPLIITHNNKAVAKIIPYKDESDPEEVLKSLRGTVKFYEDPDEPVGLEDWEALR